MPLINFSSKAGTLKNLERVVKTARIPSMHCLKVSDWNKNKNNCLKGIFEKFNSNNTLIVRSSSRLEDTAEGSNAGAFLSIQNVDFSILESSVEKVIASFGKEVSPHDEVLIQPMLENVTRAGVALSHDPNTCSPYRIVNWSEGNDTSSVTAGLGGQIWQQAAKSKFIPEKKFSQIISLLEELLLLFGNVPIDCEFAITNEKEEKDILWLLQVRRLILSKEPESETTQFNRLKLIEKKVERGMHPHPFLIGKRTVFGVMPDWNPAEIVGVRPQPLALSLYRELITDAIWAYQRNNYGYRNLRSFPLMPNFFGLPYIDVRLSFNSFIPADLNESLAGRLVDHYINRLLTRPTLHDKVEFEIVFSCYTLDLPQRLKSLLNEGFLEKEIQEITSSLRNLTNRIVHPKEGLWRKDAARINILKSRRNELLHSNADPLERIYWLIEDAKRYGTLPFAGLARAGFIAIQMLKSLVSIGVFSETDYDAFLASLSTVSGQLACDRSILDKATFLSQYGHLRPGTYDILSPRYDEEPDLYFDWTNQPKRPEEIEPFTMSLQQMREIMKLFDHHGLSLDPIGLFDFMQSGIELRELAKFHFSRNISDVLALIVEVGKKYGFKREELAYCDIKTFQEIYISANNPKDIISCAISDGKRRYEETLRTSLPPLITSPNDVWNFQLPETEPNFITQKQVIAKVVEGNLRKNINGCIICIPNADPGFDWLFSSPIAGLITAWGGVNSHMAIRAGELGIPAVIGAGEVLFSRWSKAKRLFIDCAGKKVDILK